eukprot:jgi/Mesvir1/16451/Mv25315-RA.1
MRGWSGYYRARATNGTYIANFALQAWNFKSTKIGAVDVGDARSSTWKGWSRKRGSEGREDPPVLSAERARLGSGDADGEALSPGGCWATTSARLVSPLPAGSGEAAASAAAFSRASASAKLRCVEGRLLVIYCVIDSENYISMCVLERRSDSDIHG